jgi:hypothetical protein
MTPRSRPLPKAKAISCPNCGGTVELRGLGTSLHAACVQCLSILDVSHPSVKIVQNFENAQRRTPKIPLGTRGKLKGKTYEVLGFQTRAIYVEGTEYTWDEYTLFNPYHGFRYLSEYAGHWTDIEPMPSLPYSSGAGSTEVHLREGSGTPLTFKLFQTAVARTVFVMGEFPWRVHVGDEATARDYTAPPLSLSEEVTGNEVTWSRGRYLDGKQLWQAFQLKGSPPAPQGIYFNEPNPYASPKSLWAITAFFTLALIVLMIFTWIMSRNERAYHGSFTFASGAGEPSFVTPSFELKGKEDNVQVELKTDLNNDWAYFDFALINEDTGVAYNFGKEVSYHYGRDSDGSWTEGDNSDSVRIGGIPGGRYYLRVEPEMERSASGLSQYALPKNIHYELNLIRGKAVVWPFFLVMPFLWIPPIFSSIRRFGFEAKRWAESDPAGAGAYSSSSSEDDDD